MAIHDNHKERGASLEAVLAELNRGKPVPRYLLYGDEEFRLNDAVEELYLYYKRKYYVSARRKS